MSNDIYKKIEANRRSLERCRALLREAKSPHRSAGLKAQIQRLLLEQAELKKEQNREQS